MRRELVGVALWLAAQSAWALGGWGCVPQDFAGTGTPLNVVSTDKGQAFWWICDRDKPSTTGILVLLNSYVPPPTCPNPWTETFRLAAQGQPLTAVAAGVLERCGVTPAAGSPDAASHDQLTRLAVEAWKAEFARLTAPPTPQEWTVAKNSTFPDRPTYLLVNGALVPNYPRAAVGAKCDCTTPFLRGTVRYCLVPSVASMAVCTEGLSPTPLPSSGTSSSTTPPSSN